MSSADIIARGWIGTPYVHQGSAKHSGCDCLGLLRGVWRELYGAEPEPVPAYTMDWSEPQRAEILWEAAARHLTPIGRNAAQAGDVVLFRMRRDAVAKHLGILSQAGDGPSFIHSYMGHGVVESPFSRPWRRRVVAAFSFP